jgi:hypothetical protein
LSTAANLDEAIGSWVCAAQYDGIRLLVRGDGQTYKFNVKTEEQASRHPGRSNRVFCCLSKNKAALAHGQRTHPAGKHAREYLSGLV